MRDSCYTTASALCMTVFEQMCDLMSIGRTTGYNLVNTPGFPKLHIGRKVLIPYRQLVEWTENNIGNNLDL